jgi:hypothetical protein
MSVPRLLEKLFKDLFSGLKLLWGICLLSLLIGFALFCSRLIVPTINDWFGSGAALVFGGITAFAVFWFLIYAWGRLSEGRENRKALAKRFATGTTYHYRKPDGSISEPQSLGRLTALYRNHLLDPETPVAESGALEVWHTLKWYASPPLPQKATQDEW